NAWTGENFRRGGYLDLADGSTPAPAFLDFAKQLCPGEQSCDEGAHHRGRAQGVLPRSPQGIPVLFQAGASPAGQDFAARTADVIVSPHGTLEAAIEFRRSIVERTVAAGRDPSEVKILPGAEIVLAPTEQEAEEKVRWVRDLQVGPEQAIALLERYWGRELSGIEPEGPLHTMQPEGPDIW